MMQPEPLVGDEWAEWYRLTPLQRWSESQKLWPTYLALGGSLDPEPDIQSPFFDAHASRPGTPHGGQACVFYGAAEFSRDVDFVVAAEAGNLSRLRQALEELQAGPIAVPPLALKYLQAGHAIHFRCPHYFQNQAKPGPAGIRFWLKELRTPQLLTHVATLHPAMGQQLSTSRPLLKAALAKDLVGLERGLLDEESAERKEDQRYWLPLKGELDALRHRYRGAG